MKVWFCILQKTYLVEWFFAYMTLWLCFHTLADTKYRERETLKIVAMTIITTARIWAIIIYIHLFKNQINTNWFIEILCTSRKKAPIDILIYSALSCAIVQNHNKLNLNFHNSIRLIRISARAKFNATLSLKNQHEQWT